MPRVQQASRPERLDAADHLEDAVELGVVADLAPGGPHAEPGRAVVPGAAGGGEDVVDVQQRLGLDLRVIARRLRAVAAVLGAAAGLDREQDADLDLATGRGAGGGPRRRGRSGRGPASGRSPRPRSRGECEAVVAGIVDGSSAGTGESVAVRSAGRGITTAGRLARRRTGRARRAAPVAR